MTRAGNSGKLVEERLGVLQVLGVEAFGEPLVDRREEVSGLVGFALTEPEPRQLRRGPEFPVFGTLTAGDFDSLVETDFGLDWFPNRSRQLEYSLEPVDLRLPRSLFKFLDQI